MVINIFTINYLGIAFTIYLKFADLVEEVTLQNDQDAKQKHQDRNSIDNMHGLNVYILWPIGILPPKEVPSYFAKAKKICKPIFFGFVIHSQKFSINSRLIQLPSSLMMLISSSTACLAGTFFLTTSLPRYNVIRPGPDPTYP